MMKPKKILTSRPFIIGTLTFLCLGTLVISIYLSNDKGRDFVPDPTPARQLTDSWEEKRSDVPSSAPSSSITSSKEAGSKTNEDQYPKEVKNKDNNVVVDFTNPEPEKPKAPEKPVTSSDTNNPNKHPEYKAEETKPPASKSSIPAPGSKNEKGEIYDPVFGWIKPGAAEAKPIHNNGDPNKQIGSMDSAD